jgi:non-ribosomal peptide synthetase component E (peptide arylation enzyme)
MCRAFNRADLARIVRVLNFPGLLSILYVGSRPILILRIKTQANVYMYLAIKSNTYIEKTQLFGFKRMDASRSSIAKRACMIQIIPDSTDRQKAPSSKAKK